LNVVEIGKGGEYVAVFGSLFLGKKKRVRDF
jgi:hypothetical protein